MPVLATIATINFFFGGGSAVGFLEPAVLRARIERRLETSDTQERALALVEELEQLTARYDKSVAASIEAYVTESTNAESRAAELIAILDPLDRSRQTTLHAIVQVRESMRKLLTVAQWDRVFR